MKYHKGFTILEILVVISLIAVFTTLILTQIRRTRNLGSDTQRASLARSVTAALETFKVRYGTYPTSLADTRIDEIQRFSDTDKNLTNAVDKLRYFGFDLDGNTDTCEAYSVSILMASTDARELQHDDDRIIKFGGSGLCKTPDYSALESCTANNDSCVYGKPYLAAGDSSNKAKDWVFDLSNLPQ